MLAEQQAEMPVRSMPIRQFSVLLEDRLCGAILGKHYNVGFRHSCDKVFAAGANKNCHASQFFITQQRDDLLFATTIEVGGGFICKQHKRLGNYSAGYCDSLPLA